jgi:hypothetical protein
MMNLELIANLSAIWIAALLLALQLYYKNEEETR